MGLFSKLGSASQNSENSIILTYDLSIGGYYDYALSVFSTNQDYPLPEFDAYVDIDNTGNWEPTEWWMSYDDMGGSAYYVYGYGYDLCRAKIVFRTQDPIIVNADSGFGLTSWNSEMQEIECLIAADFSSFNCRIESNPDFLLNCFSSFAVGTYQNWLLNVKFGPGMEWATPDGDYSYLFSNISTQFCTGDDTNPDNKYLVIEDFDKTVVTTPAQYLTYMFENSPVNQESVMGILRHIIGDTPANIYLTGAFKNTFVNNANEILDSIKIFIPYIQTLSETFEYSCVKTVDLSKYLFQNLISFEGTFAGSNLESIKFPLSLPNLTTAKSMCQSTKLTQVDMSSLSWPLVQNMEAMYGYCFNLLSATIENSSFPKLINTKYMFRNCTKMIEFRANNDIAGLNASSRVTGMFQNITTSGTYYYNDEYTSLNTIIYNVIPTPWKKQNANNYFEAEYSVASGHVSPDSYITLFFLDSEYCDDIYQLQQNNILTRIDWYNWSTNQWVETSPTVNSNSYYSFFEQHDETYYSNDATPDMGIVGNINFIRQRTNYTTNNKTAIKVRFYFKQESGCASSGYPFAASHWNSLVSIDLSHFNLYGFMGDLGPTPFIKLDGYSNIETLQHVTLGNLEEYSDIVGWFQGQRELVTVDFTNSGNFQCVDLSQAFYDCRKLQNIYGLFAKLGSVQNMRGAFYNCENLVYLDKKFIGVPSQNKITFSNLTILDNAFENCPKLSFGADYYDSTTQCYFLSVKDFLNCEFQVLQRMIQTFATDKNTSSIVNDTINGIFRGKTSLTNVSGCFQGQPLLTEIKMNNLSFSNTGNIDLSYLFKDCKGVETVTFASWTTSDKVINFRGIFENCYKLVEVSLGPLLFNTNVIVTDAFKGISTSGWYYPYNMPDPLFGVIPSTWNYMTNYIEMTFDNSLRILNLYYPEKDFGDVKVFDIMTVNSIPQKNMRTTFIRRTPWEFDLLDYHLYGVTGDHKVKIQVNQEFIQNNNFVDFFIFADSNFKSIDFSHVDLSKQTYIKSGSFNLFYYCSNCTSVIWPTNMQQLKNFDSVYKGTSVSVVDLSNISMPNIETFEETFASDSITQVYLPEVGSKINNVNGTTTALSKLKSLKGAFMNSKITTLNLGKTKSGGFNCIGYNLENMWGMCWGCNQLTKFELIGDGVDANNSFRSSMLSTIIQNNQDYYFEKLQDLSHTFRACSLLESVYLTFITPKATNLDVSNDAPCVAKVIYLSSLTQICSDCPKLEKFVLNTRYRNGEYFEKGNWIGTYEDVSSINMLYNCPRLQTLNISGLISATADTENNYHVNMIYGTPPNTVTSNIPELIYYGYHWSNVRYLKGFQKNLYEQAVAKGWTITLGTIK